MRLNNKGFAISSIMYIILVLAIVLITLTLGIFSNRKMILDKKKKETLNEIYGTRYKDVINNLKDDAIVYANNNSVEKESIQIKNMNTSVSKDILEEHELLNKYLTIINNNGNYDIYLGESITIDKNNEEVENLIDIIDYTIEGNSVQSKIPDIKNPVEVKNVGDTNLFDKNKAPTAIKAYIGHELINPNQEYTLKIKLKEGKTVPSDIYFGFVYYREETSTGASAEWIINNGALNPNYGDGVNYALANLNTADYYFNMVGCYPSTQENWNKVLDAFEITLVEGKYNATEIPDNLEYGKYSIPISIKSKNLIDKYKASYNELKTETAISAWGYEAFSNEWIKRNLKPNTEYTISYDVECVSVPEYDIEFANNTGFYLYNPNNVNTSVELMHYEYLKPGDKRHVSKTFTTPNNLFSDEENFMFLFYTNRYEKSNGDEVLGKMIFSNVQLELGDKETKYVPYVNENTIISLNNPLMCINSKCDSLNFSSKKLVKKNNMVEINTFEYYHDTNYRGFAAYGALDDSYSTITGLSNMTGYIGEYYDMEYENAIWIGAGNDTLYWIFNYFYDESLDDTGVSDLNEFLSKQPLKIYYNMNASKNNDIELNKIKTGLGYDSTISINTITKPSSVKFIGIKKISKL